MTDEIPAMLAERAELRTRVEKAEAEVERLRTALDCIPFDVMKAIGPPYTIRLSVEAFTLLCDALDPK